MKNLLKKILPDKLKKWVKVFLHPSRVVVLPYKPSYEADGFATIHSPSFMDDTKFMQAYHAGEATGSWSNIHWRAYVYAWCATQAIQHDGDFVECGVNRGGYARMTFEYLNLQSSDKKFWLLDTFSGFNKDLLRPEEIDIGILNSYNYDDCYEDVKKTFSQFKNAVIIKGSVPETLAEINTEKVAFLSIDMNCVEPEIATINYLWEKLSPGAIILLDDYGHPLHIAQKKAFDLFTKEKNVTILNLPTEQGIIIKPNSATNTHH